MQKDSLRITLLILALFALVRCGSMQMRYTAQIKTEDGRKGEYELFASKDLNGTPVFCAITGVIYGGWCWAYLFYPTSGDKREMAEKAKKRMDAEFGIGKYTAYDEYIERASWKNDPPEAAVKFEERPPLSSK
jgi:hypothetical protein